MTTDQLTGRALDEAAARAMGWRKPSETGRCDDCGWPLRRPEEPVGCEVDRCSMVARADWRRADALPRPSVESALAWLHGRGWVDIQSHSELTECTHSTYGMNRIRTMERGTDLREALARLVVAVAAREAKA